MPINSVALANTFNEFRTTVNEVITTVNGVSGGSGVINANTLIGGTVTANNLTSGRVTLATTSGQLTDDSALTYDTSTDILTLAGTTDASSSTTGTLKVAGGLGVAKKLYVGTDLNVGGNSVFTGNISFLGSNTLISTTVVNIEDNILQLSHLNPSDLVDIGFIGGYNNGANVHSGLFRDATDDTWKLFRNYTAEPSTTIDVSANGFAWANLAIGALSTANSITVATGQTYKVNNVDVLSATTLGSSVVTSSLTSVGTIGTGVWQGTLIDPTYGGTGVNNGVKTVTLGGNLVTSGAFNTTLTATANTTVTLPTSGTLVGSADTGTVTSTMIADGTIVDGDINASAAIAVSKLASSAVTVGTTAITLGTSSTTLAGLTSVTSTSFVGALTGNASTVTTNANLTGGVTSVGNAATVVTNANLTGAVTSVGNATSLGSFTSAQLLGALTDETGTGAAVFATSPTLVTPALGTPSALVGTNITGTATSFTASNVTTNANLTGHITSVGNAAVLGSFTSAQLLAALTDETGTGAAVFATSPTLVTPALGTPSSGVVTNLTGTASININGTVGATTASTGAFTTVTATGSIQGQASNAFKMNSNSGQYYHFDNGSGNNFMGLSAANVVDLYAGGALSATFRSTGLTATAFSGPLTGAVTGNASTATTLQTARAINGVSFDGSAAITVTAAAGTLSGASLASGVTASSLTSVGTLSSKLTTRQAGITFSVGNSSQLEINNAASGAAIISFHREGVYGAHFGLDTDNVFSTYGWSAGAGYTAMRVGNFTATGTISATGTGSFTGALSASNLSGTNTGDQTNISGNSATVGNFTPSVTAGVANRVVVADSNGYIYNNWFNSTDGSTGSGVTAVMVKQGDNWLRSGTAAAIATFISGQSMNISGSATSAPLLSGLGNYVWSASTAPASYSLGIQSSFVSSTEGFPNYGSVMTMNSYSGGGGALQMYVPYGPNYGGTGLQVRFGNYDAGNVWTSFKTLLASDNYNSYAPTLTGTGASGTWGISVTGNSATVGGFTPSASSGVGNRVVVADGNGYIVNSYFYTGGGGSERSASGMGYFAGFNSGDYYIRSYTPAAVATAISGQTMNINGSATGLSATLAVASGGTGTTTLASNNVLLGNGTSAVQVVAPSTSGNVLTSNGTTWVSQAISAGLAKGQVYFFTSF